jgi:hypothetical protein
MKGLIVAIGMGIAAAIFNAVYLSSRSQDLEMIDFIGVKPEVTINRGDRLQEEHLQKVSIARANAGNLVKFAEPYESLKSMIGMTVHRTLEGGSLLMRTDTKTPPPELIFGEQTQPGVEEVAIGVPIDAERIVPSLIKPGDLVSFLSSRSSADGPTLASPSRSESAKADTPQPVPDAEGDSLAPADEIERIGPFRVLSLGTRLGTVDVARAARQGAVQENVMMVAVRIENDKFEPKAMKLLRLMERSRSRALGYVLHAPQKKVASLP